MATLLHHIIDEAAARSPDHEAFRCNGKHVSYETLVRRTNRLARVLIENGVRPGDRVGIYLRKSLETAVAVYGILKSGAAYVPLDPGLPPARLAAILADCGIRHLVSHDALRPQIHALAERLGEGSQLQCLVGPDSTENHGWKTVSWKDVETAPPESPSVRRMASDMAYLMYTSGSTGRPKGIVHTHASGLRYAQCAADVYDLRSTDRLSGFPPLHFDQSTFDYFSGPIAGATTVIIAEAYMMLPASLSKHMQDERLSIWYSVPYALMQLLQRGALDDRDLRALRWVLFGGEAFPIKHLRALMQQWPHARFSNVYGPAEVNQCTFYHLPGPPDDDAAAIPIGALWSDAEGLVLDEQDQALPAGEVGELVVRSPTMMQGYWNHPDLNARAFYHEPSCDLTRPFYRTGDLVRRDENDLYWFLGRKDRQVKTRGYRVELDEVEAALVKHASVAEAAVYTLLDRTETAQIYASVLLQKDVELTAQALLDFAALHLPAYARPLKIEFVDDFPRTSSGKIDHRALQHATFASSL